MLRNWAIGISCSRNCLWDRCDGECFATGIIGGCTRISRRYYICEGKTGMYVKDYEFIYKIDVLFQKEIVIYGAGKFGKRTANLLNDIHVPFSCFCDRDEGRKEYLGHPVISVEQLKNKTKTADCMIVIGSLDYCREIADSLQEQQVDAYICTWYGLQCGIELHIEDKRIPRAFAADLVQRKAIWENNLRLHRKFITRTELCTMSDPVLIYQPGKVASTTIYRTLQKAKMDVVHIHYFFASLVWNVGSCVQWDVPDEEMICLFEQLKRTNRTIKIITAVREPVSRALAHFMQAFNTGFIRSCTDADIEKSARAMVEQFLEEDNEFLWFDKELKQLTGIDVFEEPFDKARGYTEIKKDGVEVLVLKMEQLNENEDVLGAFVAKPGLRLADDNKGVEKHYQYIYEELKRTIRIPRRLIERQYKNNRRMDHFYTQEEQAGFMQKWSGNIAGPDTGL